MGYNIGRFRAAVSTADPSSTLDFRLFYGHFHAHTWKAYAYKTAA